MHDLLIQSFNWTLRASFAAAVAALVVGCMQLAVGRRISPTWRAAMWGLVMIRLIVALPANRFSAMNFLTHPAPRYVPAMVTSNSNTTVVMGIIPASSPAPALLQVKLDQLTLQPAFDWRMILAALWLSIATLLLVRVLLGNVWFHRRLLEMADCEDPRLLHLLDSCRRKVGAPPVRLIESAGLPGPALFGLFNPTLLMPAGLSARLSDAELEFIFTHELTHARRHDLLIDWLLAPIVIIHWFNPIAWLAARQLRVERELACDERVLADRSPEERATYGQTILRIFEEFSASRPPILTAGMIDPRGSLRRRIRAIAQPATRSMRFTALGLFTLLAIGCATLTTAPSATPPAASSATSSGNLEVRVYDVHDLLVNIPNFDNAPEFNADLFHSKPTPPAAQKPAPARQDMLNDLVREIQSNVEPASWQSVGLGTISADEKNDRLTVTQTQSNQAKVWQYLQQLRAERGTQIVIEARFFRGGDDLASRLNNWPTTSTSADISAGNTIVLDIHNPKQAADLLTNAQSDPKTSTISAPRLIVLNGQRAYIEVATSRAFVKDLHPITSTTQPTTTPGYAPDIATVDSGILLDVQANASADHKYITLTLKPQISNLIAMNTVRWPGAPADRNDLVIQIPTVEMCTAHTTISVPDHGQVLLQMASHTDPRATTQPSPQSVFLLVHATIHEANDPNAKPSPLSSAHPATAPAAGAGNP